MNRYTSALLLVAVLCAPAAAQDRWPQFRGPDARGVSEAAGLPIRWSTTENVAWVADLPGLGWSSPVVWDDTVYVTSRRQRRAGRRTAGRSLSRARDVDPLDGGAPVDRLRAGRRHRRRAVGARGASRRAGRRLPHEEQPGDRDAGYGRRLAVRLLRQPGRLLPRHGGRRVALVARHRARGHPAGGGAPPRRRCCTTAASTS